MASEKDLELLDQYVSNRLAAQERAAFEQRLAGDSSLKTELQIQQRIVEKIRQARVKELKTMFNNVPVSALETGTSPIAKAALWVAAAGAIGIGAYLLLKPEHASSPDNIARQEQVVPQSSTPSEPSEAPSAAQGPVAEEQNNTPSSEQNDNQEMQAEDSRPIESQKSEEETPVIEEPKSRAPLDVFDPAEDAESPASERAVEERITDSTPLNKSSIIVETDNTNRKYTFHYQFKNGKLLLYGTFEKNLYEIMEFFSDNKRTVFLYYKDSYYLLNEENEAIKPLAPINDAVLVKKLKDYRGGR